MKQRVISGAVGVLVAIIILTLNITHFPFLLNIAIAAVACVSLYEIMVATKFISNPAIVIASFAVTAGIMFIPVFPEVMWVRIFAGLGAAYMLTMFIILLCLHKKKAVERIALAITVTQIIALPFYSLLYMYWKSPYDAGEFRHVGQALVIFTFCVSWFADMGAYFVGSLIGKHKLAPTISPKKTIEGVVGGFIFCLGMTALVSYLLTGPLHVTSIKVNWLYMMIITAVSSIISVIGDLSFSIIKRAFKVKDFGNIMPGHGGVLDRFDSVIFVSPVVCIMNMYMPIIIK